MFTKYGEINDYKDFFEVIKTEKECCGNAGAIIIDTLKCKICGHILKDFNNKSSGDMRYSGQYERHIKIHIAISQLNIEIPKQ